MSLELVIQENTNAIRDLIAAIAKGVPATAAQIAAVAVEAKQEAAPVEAKKEEAAKVKPPKEEAKQEAQADKAAEQQEGDAGKPADAPTYQDAASAITKLAKTKGRDAAVTVLSQFSAAKLPDVKPEDFAAVITAANAALEA